MKLCVLMPVFNEERYIASAIASILDGSGSMDIEIVIVDDGSEDGTVGVIHQLSKTEPSIRLICQKNRGVASARNTLLKAIPEDCDWVTFLDGDDAFVPGYLELTCRRMMMNPSLELIYAQLCQVESDAQDLASAVTEDVTVSRSISLSIGIYRPALLKKTGAFDPVYVQAEDLDFLLRLFESAPHMQLSDEVAVLYRQHSGNMTKNTAVARRHFARAMLGHAKRCKANPNLASMKGIFKISQRSTELLKRRIP